MSSNNKIEYIAREELESLQFRRLKDTLERVYKSSPFYRKMFKENGLNPSKFKSLKDLSLIPFTTRQDLRDNFPYGLLSVPLEKVIRLHTSTGTTGKPKAVLFTQKDIDQASELIARSMRMTGAKRDDVFQNMMSYGLFTGGLIFHYGAEKLGLLVIPAGAGNTERQIQLMRDFKTTVIHITPSYALYLADVMEDMGLDPKHDLSLRIAYLGAEPYSEETRVKIQDIFGVDAYNSYGLSEMNGPGVAFECREKEGMHLWEDNFIMEIIDPSTGKVLEDGEEGELVLTSINREAMPILRYRTGDLTYIYPERCRCGRTHRRIARLKGRVDDMFIVRGVNVFPSEIERVLMSLPEVGRNYQIVLEREKNLDKLRVRVEVKGDLFNGSLEHLRKLEDRIRTRLRSELMLTPQVELVEAGSLPRTTGKAKRVIDKRKI
ncbi:phenylacetate--CoA ligase [Candidatus Aerophobetes bacterium]|uniref:Phenylacetate-coenzyme A ligase n=1 Tax=Aerophobetes bacterium TaxID=2030807 RepID=A0A497E3U5_UNCAE|nr:MAG: phenylacetate--CoA ligase [Candidatus Aerophobetes bacterium]